MSRDRAMEIVAEAGMPPDPDHVVTLADEIAAAHAIKTVSLAALIRDGVPPPQLLPGDLLYSGGIHVVAGEPDSGKTTIALWLALALLRTGRTVLFLDEEGGSEMIAEKLIALGATEDDVAALHYAPFPARTWNAADIAGLDYTMRHVRPDMVLADSAAAFLARAGLDESSAPDVTRWWSQVLTPLARTHGAAVVVIDHDTKAGGASRYSRGSGAKLAASDVMIKVELVRPFTRTDNGVLRLAVTKDRRGWLHRWWDVQVRTSGGMSLFVLPGTEDGASEDTGLSPAETKVESVLDGTPATVVQITERIVAKYHHGLRRETVSAALNKALKENRADVIDPGPGRAKLWTVCAGMTCELTGPLEEGG